MRDWAIRFEIFCEPEWLALRFRKCARRSPAEKHAPAADAPQRGRTAKGAHRKGLMPRPNPEPRCRGANPFALGPRSCFRDHW